MLIRGSDLGAACRGYARWRGWVLLVVLLGGAPSLAEARYTMRLQDGTQVSDDFLRDWFEPGKKPTVAGRALFDPANPARLLGRIGAQRDERRPRIGFDNGDVLAGRVTGYELDDDGSGARLVVRLDAQTTGLKRDRQTVRVLAERVVWVSWEDSAFSGSDAAGRLRFADGSEMSLEALTWTATGVRALSGDRVLTATFEELARVHPPRDPADADTVAQRQLIPGATGNQRVASVRLSDGSLLSFAIDQMQMHSHGKKQDHEVWHHVQPVWADERLAYALAGVVGWSFRDADQVPLSVLPAQTVYARSAAGHTWAWRADASVRGGDLMSGGMVAPRGVGMHASSAIAYALPKRAVSLSGVVGIDEAVGRGGCAIAEVYLDDRPRVTGKPAWRSGFLLGGQALTALGPVSLAKKPYAVLVADDAHVGRPSGADPFDIRDQLNWLSPLVELEGLEPRPAQLVPGLAGWEVSGKAAFGRAFDKQADRWWPTIHTDRAGLTLQRKLRLGPSSAFLEFRTDTEGQAGEHELVVELDGQPIKTTDGQAQIDKSKRKPGQSLFTRYAFAGQREGEGEAGGEGEAVLTIRITQPRDQAEAQAPGLILSRLVLRSLIEGRPNGRSIAPAIALVDLTPMGGWPDDKPLTRLSGDGAEEGVEMHGRRWGRGLVSGEGLDVTFAIPPGARRFVAVVGAAGTGDAGPFKVAADANVLAEVGQRRTSSPLHQIEVVLPPGAQLLTISHPKRSGRGAWVDAGFLLE